MQGSLSDNREDKFQLLVLDVICQNVMQEVDHKAVKYLLKKIIEHLKSNLGWLDTLSNKQRLSWTILTTCCSKIKPFSENLDWIDQNCSLLIELGSVFSAYCACNKDLFNLAAVLPHEIQSHHFEELKRYTLSNKMSSFHYTITARYFVWVAEIHRVLDYWCNKFHLHDISYNEVIHYESTHNNLVLLGHTLHVSSLVVDVCSVKNNILNTYEELNALLLCYIPGQPDAKWCALPFLLEKYRVYLPQEVQKFLENKVYFPGPGSRIPWDQLSKFTATDQTLYLRLHKNVTLKELSHFVQCIRSFQQPLIEYREMLIFFKLKNGLLFNKYLCHYQELFKEQCLPMDILVSALESTSTLICKIMEGTATYSEIIAEDKLTIEQLDIRKEFLILSEYCKGFLKLNFNADYGGFNGYLNILELFKFAVHISNIKTVCEQYHLEKCLHDPHLQELVGIMESLTEEWKLRITSLVAYEKMKKVKEILGFEAETSSKCMDIFPAMTDSVSFYQFMRDKQFYGEKGHAIFMQQYQLITAQLQHEEYDEQVLNHLVAALKFIYPFMDTEKDFKELMSEVLTLNVVDGLKQLKTVTANINLIKLWFSRVEVSQIIISKANL